MKLIRLAAIPAALALAASTFILVPSAFAGTKPPDKTCTTVTTTTYKQVKECPFTGCRELVSADGGQWR